MTPTLYKAHTEAPPAISCHGFTPSVVDLHHQLWRYQPQKIPEKPSKSHLPTWCSWIGRKATKAAKVNSISSSSFHFHPAECLSGTGRESKAFIFILILFTLSRLLFKYPWIPRKISNSKYRSIYIYKQGEAQSRSFSTCSLFLFVLLDFKCHNVDVPTSREAQVGASWSFRSLPTQIVLWFSPTPDSWPRDKTGWG